MNNNTYKEEIFQSRFAAAQDYYNDAPESIWENPIVIRSIRLGEWGRCGITTGEDGQPIQGLVHWTLDGYYFKYKGTRIQQDCAIQ